MGFGPFEGHMQMSQSLVFILICLFVKHLYEYQQTTLPLILTFVI